MQVITDYSLHSSYGW